MWKALFYSMWYSDKIPVQQELAFNIARLTRSLKGDSRAVLFLSTFFATLSREWIGIDHLRMDKYLSLTRRMLHEAIRLTAQASFSAETLAAVEGLLAAVLAGRPNGIRYHIVDCFLEEVGAAAPGIRTEQLQRLLAPLYAHCVVTDDRFLYERVAKEVVQGLVQRTSDAQAPASEDADAEEGAAGAVKASESPLLIDAAARRAALASAFKQIKLAPIARDVFSLAAFRCVTEGLLGGGSRQRCFRVGEPPARERFIWPPLSRLRSPLVAPHASLSFLPAAAPRAATGSACTPCTRRPPPLRWRWGTRRRRGRRTRAPWARRRPRCSARSRSRLRGRAAS